MPSVPRRHVEIAVIVKPGRAAADSNRAVEAVDQPLNSRSLAAGCSAAASS